MAVTTYQSNRILDNLFGNTPLSPTTNFYIGLSKTPIQKDGSGYTEPSGAGYTRVQVQNNKSNFSVAREGTLSNSADIQFPESTGGWGTLTHVFVSDSPSSGNVLYFDALTNPRTVESLTTLLFSTGTLQVTLS